MNHKIELVEFNYRNLRSAEEHVLIMIFSLVRDYHNQHRIVIEGG